MSGVESTASIVASSFYMSSIKRRSMDIPLMRYAEEDRSNTDIKINITLMFVLSAIVPLCSCVSVTVLITCQVFIHPYSSIMLSLDWDK